VVSNTLMMFLMLLVIAVSSSWRRALPIAALAQTAPVTVAIAAEPGAERHLRHYVSRCSRSPPRAIFALLAHRCIRRRWRRWSAREKDALIGELAGEIDIRRSSPSRGNRPTSRKVAVSGANEP